MLHNQQVSTTVNLTNTPESAKILLSGSLLYSGVLEKIMDLRNMSQEETALGAALKNAVRTMSKKKQTEMIAAHVYSKFDVFKRFKPLAIGINEDLIAALPQFDPVLITRVLVNHCRRPRYLKALAHGGNRFDLNNRVKGKVSPEEQALAQNNPLVQASSNKQAPHSAVSTEQHDSETA